MCSSDLTRLNSNVSAILDARHIYFDDEDLDQTDDYTSLFAGFEFRPAKKVSLVLAYGVDPLDFRIDYEGRHIGRWRFRQEYLWSNPTATWRDAEDALADRRMITLRAIWNF